MGKLSSNILTGRQWLLTSFLLVGGLALSTSPQVNAQPAGSLPGGPSAEAMLTWQLEMDVPAESIAMKSGTAAADMKAQLADVLSSKLQGADTARTVDEITLAGQPAFRVTLQGKANNAQLQQLFFGSLAPEFDVLGGPMELVITGHATSGQTMPVSLESRPSTGYAWQVAPESTGFVVPGGEFTVRQKTQLLGSPASATIVLKAAADADVTVRLEYRRPWEKQAVTTRRLSVQAVAWPSTLDLTNPVLPPSAASSISYIQSDAPLPPRNGLPTSWDWRAQGGVTSVRDQSSCGSCWAFGTVGVLESAIKIHTAVATDLSEQFLISCNNDGYSCNGGWWDAHDYHTDEFARLQSQVGAVYETDMPYSASNGTCKAIANHPFRQNAWNYIVDAGTIPTVDQIKNAIYTYGPVGVSICAGSGFQSYSGGVFSTDDSAECAPLAMSNHSVVLVGWDDNNGSGYWILRNSWGSGWGENGYMRIRWGTSHVGYAANYVQFAAQPDVKITKAVLGRNLAPGDPVTFTLSIANVGSAPANNVIVTDTLPAEVVAPTIASSIAMTQVGGTAYVWNVAPLPVGQGAVITITGYIDGALLNDFSFGNTATISDPLDSNLGNNTSSVAVSGGPSYLVYLPLIMTPPVPVTATLYSVADAPILQGYATYNYGNTIDMWAGYDEYLSPYGKIVRSLVRFDTSAIPPSVPVTQATLKLYLVEAYDYPNRARTITPYRITGDWSEYGVTWNSAPAIGEAGSAASVLTSAWGWKSFNVTAIVQKWVSGAQANYGFLLRGPEVSGSDSSWRGFSTREGSYAPQLVVTYLGSSTMAVTAAQPAAPGNGRTLIDTLRPANPDGSVYECPTGQDVKCLVKP